MTYLPQESRIIYRFKDKRQEKTFDVLDWSCLWRDNVSRGIRQKENQDALIPCVLEPDENKKPNRNWARLIQKIAACPGPDPGR